ncbi:MAG: hypothetical protein ACJ788_13480 [Ktedonobacteraceae bacterium]
MAEVEVERLAPGLYRLRGPFPNEPSIMVTAQHMLTLMDWGQHNIRELEDEARKINRRAERRKRKS